MRSTAAATAASKGKGESGAFMETILRLKPYNPALMEHMKPLQAHAFLQANPEALFIDCRSEMEYMFVGHPVGAMMVPWYDGGDWELNPHFVSQVKKIAGANFDKRPVVLICRSGNRTIEAGE